MCPQRSAPSVCAPSARRALGPARPQLSMPQASAPSVQEPRSVLVCRRPVVFIMCSSCAVCPWWALDVCVLGQVRPWPSAPSARRALTSARALGSRINIIVPHRRRPLRCLSCAACPWCALSAVRPRCMCPRPGVSSARRALGQARPQLRERAGRGGAVPMWDSSPQPDCDPTPSETHAAACAPAAAQGIAWQLQDTAPLQSRPQAGTTLALLLI